MTITYHSPEGKLVTRVCYVNNRKFRDLLRTTQHLIDVDLARFIGDACERAIALHGEQRWVKENDLRDFIESFIDLGDRQTIHPNDWKVALNRAIESIFV